MKLECRDQLAGFLTRLAEAAPGMLKKGEQEFDYTILSFWLGNELAANLLSTLNEVRLELAPKHARDMEVAIAVWDELFCMVAGDPRRFIEEPDALSALIDEFGERWKAPLSDFEVVYSIDYLAIGPEPIILNGVKFFEPTDDALANLAIVGVVKEEFASWSKEAGTLTLAITRVEASSGTTSFEAGQGLVSDAVTLMRVAALRGLFGRTLTDELLQWRLSGHYLTRSVNGGPSPDWLWGWHRPFGPLVTPLGDAIREGIERLGLEAVGDLPEDVRDRLHRALDWMAHSATHEAADYKYVDLCTALEILLLPEGQRVFAKGSVIALRYNLLGGEMNPPAVKHMYDLRSHIVHGNAIPVVGFRDVWDLRSVCYTTASRIAQIAAARPEVTSLQRLIEGVETHESLSEFVRRAERGVYKGSLLPSIVKAARAQLKSLEASAQA